MNGSERELLPELVVSSAGPLITLARIDILLMGKEAGLIPTVRPVLDELRQTSLRVSDRVYREVLLKAGEAWPGISYRFPRVSTHPASAHRPMPG